LLEETNQIQAGSIQFVSARTLANPGAHSSEQAGNPPAPVDLSLKNSERALIAQALEKTGGNKTRAATLLGISRDVLRYRMKKLNLDAD
jgi:DNA-binding NtrC family response regulator